MTIKQIIIARHADYISKTGRLSLAGEAQAQELAEKIARVVTVPAREIKLIVTPAIRTWQTAQLTAERLNVHEIRSTPFESMPHAEIQPMLTTKWPEDDSDEYSDWSVAIFFCHEGELEYMPADIGVELGAEFPRYPEQPYCTAVMIDCRAKTCQILE